MTMLDTALKTAEWIGLRDRTTPERARGLYNTLTAQASSLMKNLPEMPALPSMSSLPELPSMSALPEVPVAPGRDWTGILIGYAVGVVVGFGVGIYLKDSVKPAVEFGKKQARTALDTVQDIPTRLNITRMDEEPAEAHKETSHQS